MCGYALGTVAARMGAPLRGWLLYLVADGHALSALVFMLLAWGFCFALWELHILGGGDAKTLMGIVALFPIPSFAVFLAVAVLILSLPLLVLSLRGKRLSGIPQALGKRLEEGHIFPTQQDLVEHGRPYAWTFCLPAAVYLWLLW